MEAIGVWLVAIMVLCGFIAGILDAIEPRIERWKMDRRIAKKKQAEKDRATILQSAAEAKKGRERGRRQHDDDGVGGH